MLDLKSPAESPTAAAIPSRWPWVAVVAVAVIAGVIFAGLWLRGSSTSPQPVALTLELPESSTATPITGTGGSAISPDGRTVAFVAANDKGENLLYVRPLESLAARPLPDTQQAGRPFWSPVGKSLAFIAKGKLKRIDLAGGPPFAFVMPSTLAAVTGTTTV